MWHYLGRTKLASDGINLTFGADPFNPSALAEPPKKIRPGDKPWVYIPPAGFKAPSANDEVLRTNVKVILSEPAADIQFRFAGAALFAGEIRRVRDLISQRRIAVQYDSSLTGIAKYVHPDHAVDGNTLKAGFSTAASVWHRALIVHEAVHAVFDVRGTKTVLREAEAAAYVAQAIHLIRHRQLPHFAHLPTLDMDIFTAAEQVATWVIGIRPPPRVALVALANAIAAKYPAGEYAFDGVP